MKLFLPLLAVVAATTASARIGETRDQCHTRYGASTGEKGPFVLYSKGHVSIGVLFKDGVSIREVFSPEAGSKFSDNQIAEFLTANSEGSSWLVVSENLRQRKYERADGKAVAFLEWATSRMQLSIWRWDSRVPSRKSDNGF